MKQTVLVAPLNWGLGHATRCIPIIQALLKRDVQVLLASDGRAYDLLAQEFPTLPIFRLPAYNISYTTRFMVWNIAVQLPKIAYAIIQEQLAIRRLVKQQQIDAIISDNRFGCFHFGISTVFMTHQINLKIPFRPLEILARWGNRVWIRLFNTCWIPDVADEPNLSGALSHGISLQNKAYLGVLSRMQASINSLPAPSYDAIAVISGPEPQRTYFERAILKQAASLPYRFLVVGGKPEQHTHTKSANIEYVSFMNTKTLNTALLSSGVVISRSGYSTLMDLACLGQKAILVPTPGQTEQEYLAELLMTKDIFYTQTQKEFDLALAMDSVEEYKGWQLPLHEQLEEVIDSWLMGLGSFKNTKK